MSANKCDKHESFMPKNLNNSFENSDQYALLFFLTLALKKAAAPRKNLDKHECFYKEKSAMLSHIFIYRNFFCNFNRFETTIFNPLF
jgi:hypothetical protein